MCASSTYAQQAPADRGVATADSLEEVVVTATKRDTTVQTTPLSITALSGMDLQTRGITDVSSLVGEVPGISIKSQGPGQTEFEMRGMSSTGGSSPTVGFYLDDTPITAPASSINGKVVIDPNLYDLNRVEVLRGPQGTLYGASSMGGTIRLITNQPNSTRFEASAAADTSYTDGSGLNHSENGMINIPLVQDKLALRLVASEAHNSGWIDQIVVGDFPAPTNGGATRGNVQAAPVIADNRDVNSTDLVGFRGAILYTPTEQLSITASGVYQRVLQGGENGYDSVPGTLAHYTPFDYSEPFSDRFQSGALTVVYRFQDFDVTSATGLWSRTEKNSQDEAEALTWAFALPSVYPADGGIGWGNFDESTTTKQTSEELRFTSTGDTRFQWIFGGFYNRFSSTENDLAVTPPAAALFGTAVQYFEFQPFKLNQKAAFGEASFKFTNALKGTVGLRYYSYDSSVVTNVSGYGSSTGSDAVATQGSQATAHGVNPKFNLSYQESEDLLLYTTAAKGFRPGGPNGPVPTTPSTELGQACLGSLASLGRTAAPQTYAPDNVWSYELGEKATFLDKRITLNAALYYESWKGLAQTVSLSCGYYYYDNAGNAAIYGGELEARARLAPGLLWTGTAGYAHAALTENVLETGGHKGDPLQDVAPWTASSSLSYSVPIRADWEANARLSFDYVGPRMDVTYSRNWLPAYSLVNFRTGVSNDKWGVNLFVNNLTNKRAQLEDTYSFSINLPSYNRIATNQPLTVGLGINYKLH